MFRSALVRSLSTATILTSSAHAWFPGPGAEMTSHGFTVDAHDRADVVSFWHHVYQASADFESRAQWTGTLNPDGNCIAGTNNQALHIDTERRINFFRALCGIHTNVRIDNAKPVFTNVFYEPPLPPADTTRGEAAMLAAMSTTLAGAPNHQPNADAPCYSPATYNGAFLSSLALGLWGPDAIDGYMDEEDHVDLNPIEAGNGEPRFTNRKVGHRRWILFPGQRTMGNANIPRQTVNGQVYREVNALYNFGDLEPESPRQFVAWPNPGFIPEQIMPFRWSLSFPDADFSEAIVSVRNEFGVHLSVEVDERSLDAAVIGDKTLVWRVLGLPTVVLPNQTIGTDVDEDLKLTVDITGIQGDNVPSSYSYTVTIIDPNKLPDDLEVLGSATPTQEGANLYFTNFGGFDGASAEVRQLTRADFTDGAVNAVAETNITVSAPPGYNPLQPVESVPENFWAPFPNDENPAWNMTFQPAPGAEQMESDQFLFTPADITPTYLEVKGTLRPDGRAQMLSYLWRRGYMTRFSQLHAEYSVDGGESWIVVPGSAVRGLTVGGFVANPDAGFTAVSLPLNIEGDEVRIRLAYTYIGNSVNQGILSSDYLFDIIPGDADPHVVFPTGIFIDDIGLTGFDRTTKVAEVPVNANTAQLELSPETIGSTYAAGRRFTVQFTAETNGFEFEPSNVFQFQPRVDELSSIDSFAAWKLNSFAAIGGETDDDDNDGLPNLMEFAFGTDPLDGSDAQQPAMPQSEPAVGVSDGKFGICRVIPGLNPAFNYRAEYSADISAPPEDWTQIDAEFRDGCLRASVDITDFDGLYMRWVIVPK